MRTVLIHTANIRAKVEKTGKTYRRSYRYAKQVIVGDIGEAKETSYFLRGDNGIWVEVSQKLFKMGTSEEEVAKLNKRLTTELIERIKS